MDALDELIASLEEAKKSTLPSTILAAQLEKKLSKCSKTINDKHKEFYGSLSKLGKSLDKKFVIPIDGVADYSLFQSQLAQGALNRVVRDHLMRCGEWEVAKMFEIVRTLGSHCIAVLTAGIVFCLHRKRNCLKHPHLRLETSTGSIPSSSTSARASCQVPLLGLLARPAFSMLVPARLSFRYIAVGFSG